MGTSRVEYTIRYMQFLEEQLEKCQQRNRSLEETLRKAYIALKKHENLDVDIVGEAMGILDEESWKA